MVFSFQRGVRTTHLIKLWNRRWIGNSCQSKINFYAILRYTDVLDSRCRACGDDGLKIINSFFIPLGLIGMGDPDVVGETVMTLHAFNIPLILASPQLADSVIQEGNILTTAPDMSSVVKVRYILTTPAVLVKRVSDSDI